MLLMLMFDLSVEILNEPFTCPLNFCTFSQALKSSMIFRCLLDFKTLSCFFMIMHNTLKKNIITKRFRDQTQLNYEFQLISEI